MQKHGVSIAVIKEGRTRCVLRNLDDSSFDENTVGVSSIRCNKNDIHEFDPVDCLLLSNSPFSVNKYSYQTQS
jgi:hypothetical protein